MGHTKLHREAILHADGNDKHRSVCITLLVHAMTHGSTPSEVRRVRKKGEQDSGSTAALRWGRELSCAASARRFLHMCMNANAWVIVTHAHSLTHSLTHTGPAAISLYESSARGSSRALTHGIAAQIALVASGSTNSRTVLCPLVGACRAAGYRVGGVYARRYTPAKKLTLRFRASTAGTAPFLLSFLAAGRIVRACCTVS